jgi:hypothetical protein
MSETLMELDEDVPCKSCQYNFRRALITGICPECSCPVSESIDQWRLDRQGPSLGVTMRDGCLIVGLLVVLLLLMIVVGACVVTN